MKHLEELKEVVKRELEKFGKQGDISVSSLDKIHKLSDLYKNLCKIEMMESESDGEYSEARGVRSGSYMRGSSYDDDMMYSERRGRNAKRDSMGRYSKDGGYSEDEDYSERRMGRGYSRDEASDRIMHSLGELMEDASPKERETLKKWMRELERD